MTKGSHKINGPLTRGMPKEMRKIVLAAIERGWEFERGTKANKLRHPEYGLVTASITPSCQHAHKNLERDLERAEGRR